MCGIAGIVGRPASDAVSVVREMVERMRSRGPDHAAVIELSDAVLGHARLSILDLNPRSNQPMFDGSGRFCITYNGEAYNFATLRRELEALGHVFRTTSDTEVVLHSFLEWDLEAFSRINGMYALGIWDDKEKRLILARDRFGKKPLYYALAQREVVFGSDARAILADPTVRNRARLNVEALNQFFALGYILGPLSLWENISKLPPATAIELRDGRVRRSVRTWDYASSFRTKRREDVRDLEIELRGLIETAIKRRLVSDVPVGCFLSGGIDSSCVSAFAKRHLEYPLHTFNIGFQAYSYDESADAKSVAEHLGTVHHDRFLEDDYGVAAIDAAISCYDEPFSDTSLVPMVEVSRIAAKHVKVVLSGDGADELFGGYSTYRADALMNMARHLPRALRRVASRVVTRWAGEGTRKTDTRFRLRQFAKGLPEDWRYAHYAWRELHDEDERIDLIGAEHAEMIRDTHPFRQFQRYYDEVADLSPLDQHLYVDAKTWLVDDILVKLDRATMAFSLEARTPFLDPEVAEFAASLPSELKLKGADGKHLLKRALVGVLPASTLSKRKSGFNAPINLWFDHSDDNEFRYFSRYVWRRHEEGTGRDRPAVRANREGFESQSRASKD